MKWYVRLPCEVRSSRKYYKEEKSMLFSALFEQTYSMSYTKYKHTHKPLFFTSVLYFRLITDNYYYNHLLYDKMMTFVSKFCIYAKLFFRFSEMYENPTSYVVESYSIIGINNQNCYWYSQFWYSK